VDTKTLADLLGEYITRIKIKVHGEQTGGEKREKSGST
jgi:hypothetical protein